MRLKHLMFSLVTSFAVALSALSPVSAAQVINDVLVVTGGIQLSATLPTTAPCRLDETGDTSGQITTDGVDSTPVITQVYIGEARVDKNCLATGVAVFNGSVASGNIKVALFDANGGIVAVSASTAMSGTTAYQLIPFTAPIAIVGPSRYFIGEFIDNTTARFRTFGIGAFAATIQTGQTYATGFTTITPPTAFGGSGNAPIASLY